MRNSKATQMALVLAASIGTLFAFNTLGAEGKIHGPNQFHITVTDVVGGDDLVVKNIRIDVKSDAHAKIVSDKKGGGGLSASAGTVDNDRGQGFITVTVLGDHVEWKGGDVNALKFRMSMHGSDSAVMSDTGPMVAGKRLGELLAVSVKTGSYEYGAEVPILKFKDKTFSLIVAAPTFN